MGLEIPASAQPWQYNNDAAGALTNQSCLAAVAGKRVYLLSIFYCGSAATGTFKILDASGGNVKFGTAPTIAGTPIEKNFPGRGLLIGDGKGVFVTTTGAGAQNVNLTGYVV